MGSAPSLEHQEVQLTKDRGLKDDRFEFSKYPITLMSLEVAQEVCSALDLELDLALFRRNIIISGVHLNSLIGERFKIGEVEFEGVAHCAPCPWMNAVMKKGAYALMKGRGGLRVKVLHGGALQLGQGLLKTEATVHSDILKSSLKPKLPLGK